MMKCLLWLKLGWEIEGVDCVSNSEGKLLGDWWYMVGGWCSRDDSHEYNEVRDERGMKD